MAYYNSSYDAYGVKVYEKIIPDGSKLKHNAKLQSVKKITVHNTEDLKNISDDCQQYVRATYNNAMGGTVVNYYVDDISAWQLLKAGTGNKNDPKGSAEVGYHVADTNDKTGGNWNSISIEVIMRESEATDKIAYDNAARLCAYLLDVHGLTIDDLVTHTYWGNHGLGKHFDDVDKQCTNPNYGYRWCPAYIFDSTNPDTAYKNWKKFKEAVKKYMKKFVLVSTPVKKETHTFVPRTSAPEAGNKYYLTKAKGGYSPCLDISGTGLVYPNCVGYAVGRFSEEGGFNCIKYLGSVNAEDMPDTAPELEKGDTPKLGACICWGKGKPYNGADGFGHVAIVEKIISPTEIVTSESAHGGSAWYTKTRKKGSDGRWGMDSSYYFRCFIYHPFEFIEKEETKPATTTTTTKPTTTTTNTTTTSNTIYRVQIGAFGLINLANNYLNGAKAKGLEGFVTQNGNVYLVQVGAFTNKTNAETYLKKVKSLGYNSAYIITSTQAKKSIDEIAKEVIRGDWGNGIDRKNKLTAAGYDYNTVQKRVTELLKK